MGRLGRGGLAQIAQKAFLHEIDRKDEHDSGAQRRQHRGGLVARPVEIGEAVAQRRGQAQTRAIEQETHAAQRHSRHGQQNH